MYLLPSSCHPPHQHENVPFSLAMRDVRICSLPEARDLRISELKDMFLEQNYSLKIIEGANSKARKIPRNIAIRKVVSWDPRLPPNDTIEQKHWRVMALDPYLKQVFPEAPLVAYKRQKNLKEHLIRA